MPFSWDDYPYTNFHELNLDWFIEKFKEIFDEWDALYAEMNEWKTETEAGLEEWKTDTEQDISDWESGIISDLNDWEDEFETLFNNTFDNLSQIKEDAESARDLAQGYAQDAADSAASVSASSAQITENENDITLLKSRMNDTDNMFSDFSTLLSTNLTDKTETTNGITYTLSGNTLHCENSTSGNSLFVWAGATSSIPSFITAGEKYILSIGFSGTTTDKDTTYLFIVQIKTSDNTTLRSLYRFTEAGKYIIELPSNLTACRLATQIYNPNTVDCYITAEISNAYNIDNLLDLITENKADISTLENAIGNYLALTAADSTTMPDNSDFNNYITAGTYKITNNTHAATMVNRPSGNAGKLIVMETSQASRIWQLYFGNAAGTPINLRYYNGSTWTDWDAICHASYAYELRDRINKAKSIKIKYESGSYNNGNATERISVYLPATSGYLLVHLYHFIMNDIYCNTWRIYHVYHVDDNLENSTDLTVSGEWECAIRLDGRDDFSGGSTHGDEVMSGYITLVNGAPVNISTFTTVTTIDSFKLIRNTSLYDPADHTTVIAAHGVEYDFNYTGMVINQSINWSVAETLDNCFMAMFPPSKATIDRASANNDFTTCTLSSTTSEPLVTINKNKATAVTMWDTSGGFSAEVYIPVYPTGLTGGDSMSISDNSGNNYNKVYFKVCGGGSSTIGELWKSTTKYKMNYTT